MSDDNYICHIRDQKTMMSIYFSADQHMHPCCFSDGRIIPSEHTHKIDKEQLDSSITSIYTEYVATQFPTDPKGVFEPKVNSSKEICQKMCGVKQ